MASERLPEATILGTRVHGPTLAQTVDRFAEWIDRRDGWCRSVVVTGFHGLWVGHQDPEFRAMINGADLFCPDGIAPIWLSRLHGRPLPGRVPGPDIMAAFLKRAETEGYRSYFYGDTEQTLQTLMMEIGRRFPGAPVTGALSPAFRPLSEAEEAEHVAEINTSGADILWVGLGCPKQERWIARNKHRLTVPVAVGVGAAFRFQAGMVRRAPGWIGDAGFEWLFRLAAEPGKLWRRDLTEGPRFVAAALADAWRVRSRLSRMSGRR